MPKLHLKLAAKDIALCGSESTPWVLFKEFASLPPDTVCEACRIVAEQEGRQVPLRKNTPSGDSQDSIS